MYETRDKIILGICISVEKNHAVANPQAVKFKMCYCKYRIGYHLLIRSYYNNLMRKELATFKALVVGDASIKRIEKTPIKRTPGDTTIVGHN